MTVTNQDKLFSLYKFYFNTILCFPSDVKLFQLYCSGALFIRNIRWFSISKLNFNINLIWLNHIFQLVMKNICNKNIVQYLKWYSYQKKKKVHFWIRVSYNWNVWHFGVFLIFAAYTEHILFITNSSEYYHLHLFKFHNFFDSINSIYYY